MVLSKCAAYGSKKSTFIKKQEASGLLRSLRNKDTIKSKSFRRSSFVLGVITS